MRASKKSLLFPDEGTHDTLFTTVLRTLEMPNKRAASRSRSPSLSNKHSSDELKGKLTKFINCRIIREHKLIENDYLWVRNGKIVDYESIFFDEKKREDEVVDCKGGIIAPGFIDVQINGGFGYDFSDENNVETGLRKVSIGIIKHGVTSFVPTLITSNPKTYAKVIPIIRDFMLGQKQPNANPTATVLGCHLEGPFISQAKKGAHPSNLVRSEAGISIHDFEQVYGKENLNKEVVCIITMDPDLDSNNTVIKELSKRGIVVSLGHSQASIEVGEKAVKSGAVFITHLYNAMGAFGHRDPGLVGLLASDVAQREGRCIFYGNILDLEHTHHCAFISAYRCHPEGCVLVTDAMAALGLQEGTEYKIGEVVVEIKNGTARVAGTDTLAGAIAAMDQCVRNFKVITGLQGNDSIVKAVECATLHPALLLGIENQKGRLNFGCDADLVILDDDLNVKETYILGVKVWDASNPAEQAVTPEDRPRLGFLNGL